MPFYLEPGREVPVELDSARKPTPTFYARSLSMRMQQEISDVLELWFAAETTGRDLIERTVDVLLKYFVRAENLPADALSRDWMLDNLTYQEARDLLRTYLSNNHLDHNAKKA